MNFKKNFLIFYIFINILIIFFINVKNQNKENISIFTWQSKNYSLGNIVTFSYIAGITFNSVLTFLIINKAKATKYKEEIEEEFIEPSENEDEFKYSEKSFERPPERDIKESQPTISVNYRVIENNKYSANKFNNESKVRNPDDNFYDDWGENNKDW